MKFGQTEEKKLGKAIAKAWLDKDFQEEFIRNPRAALATFGLTFATALLITASVSPKEATPVASIEQSKNKIHFIIPEQPLEVGMAENLTAGMWEDIIDFIHRFSSC